MRSFAFTACAATLATLAWLLPAVKAAEQSARPNILFMITDDQAYDALSVVQQEQNANAVRTTNAKLIRYRGYPQWTELFDLEDDPYETLNLIDDPAAAALKAEMMREHDRLAGEVGYAVPDFVDRPPNWGQPGSLAGDSSAP